LDSFGFDSGQLDAPSSLGSLYELIATGPIRPPRRARKAHTLPGSSRRTSSVVITHSTSFGVWTASIIRSAWEERQTGTAGVSW